jgi:hypothetical protein
MVMDSSLMDFKAALKLLEAFPECHLRIFKQFSGFPDDASKEGGYIVFSDVSLAGEPCYCGLKDFVEEHSLSITHFGQYLMVYSH